MRIPLTLISLFSVALASGDAQVYFLPSKSAQHHAPAALNPTEANALISHHLGLDVPDSIGDRVKGLWNQLSSYVHEDVPATGVGDGAQDSILIVIQSDHPQDFIPPEMKQTFSIPDAPAATMFTDLIHAYAEQAHHFFDSVFSSISPFLAAVREAPAYKALLDTFDMASEAAALFVEEFGRLVQTIDDETEHNKKGSVSDDNKFSAFEIKGLAELEKDGRQSEQYLTAAGSMQAFLSNNLQNRNVVIIVVPPEAGHQKHRRAPQSAAASSLVTPASNNKVVFSMSTCFKSNDTCTESTESCSGHGSCNAVTIAGKTCYTCSCAVTKNDKGRRQWWAGQACERLDLSTPFVLLVGTALALIILVLFSVGLLQAVGYEQLPNTLTAAASGHPKRD